MITNVLIDTLKDERLSMEKKKIYMKNLDLPYSDIFKLKDIFEYDNGINYMLYSFVCYEDSNFIGKLDYKNRKQKTKEKQRKMKIRRYDYDKYKRR